MKKYRIIYLSIILISIIIEIIIATEKINDDFIRGSIGDLLILVIIYYMLRLVLTVVPIKAVIIALLIGFIVEVLQLIHIVEIFHFDKQSIMYILIGNTFSIEDLLMYVIGGSLAIIFDKYIILQYLGHSSENGK